MSNRDDEYYERSRGDRRSARRQDDGYDRRRDDRYDDRYERGRGDRYRDDRDGGYRDNRDGRYIDDRDDRYDDRRDGRRSNRNDDRYDDRRDRGREGSKKKSSTKAIVLLVVEMLVACVLVYIAYTLFFKVDVTKVGKVNLDEEAISQSISENVAQNTQMSEYTNIALFGVDSREEQLTKNTRSDTILIASINNQTGDVKLCSIYRDTYLNLSNDTYTKCNAAYAQGGPEQAISMLNMNLDMDIEDFITIGFRGLTDVVDALGGIPIDVTDAEISHLNNYQSTMAQELRLSYTPVTSPGLQTLNGLQATAYCRIRYTAGDDFRRAERQRTVLMACLDKAKTMNYSKLESVANKAFGETYTSLDLDEILALLQNIANYEVVDNSGFPYEEMRTTGTMGKAGSCVLPVDLESNVKWLHKFLFDDTDYEVSSGVSRYSEKISADVSKYIGN